MRVRIHDIVMTTVSIDSVLCTESLTQFLLFTALLGHFYPLRHVYVFIRPEIDL